MTPGTDLVWVRELTSGGRSLSGGGRAELRRRTLRWAALTAGVLVLLALVFLASGHWLLGVLFGVVAAAAVFMFVQFRTVR
jgi:hypothetical protein